MELPKFSDWEGFAVKKTDEIISFLNFRSYESRNESTMRMIQTSIQKYGVKNFDWIVINTGDTDQNTRVDPLSENIIDENGNIFPLFSYCTSTKNFSKTLPDFVFDHWKQTGLIDYEITRIRLNRFDTRAPDSELLGWRGALTHPSRAYLVSLDDKIKFDCELINWDRSDPNNLTAINFMSFEEQIAKWRYLIDLRGVGYSGRLKILLSSKRVVFIQERKYEEFFFEFLKPWEHYIPVHEDLSDLTENLNFLKSNNELENKILRNTSVFSQLYLSRDYAIFKIAELLQNINNSN